MDGKDHPRWIDGLSVLDRNAYDKRHHQRNKKRILTRKKKHSQIPAVKARKRAYDKARYDNKLLPWQKKQIENEDDLNENKDTVINCDCLICKSRGRKQ